MSPERDRQFAGWMKSAQTGDRGAYENLLKETRDLLRRYFSSRVSPQISEDLIQEVLLAVHRARHTYDSDRPFGHWLYAIARFKIIDQMRSMSASAGQVALEDVEWELSVAGQSNGESDLQKQELERALEQLPEKQRNAIHLTKLKGLSVEEAALELGISVSDVKVSAHRGYQRLRAVFEENG